jgi:hypothetical protein
MSTLKRIVFWITAFSVISGFHAGLIPLLSQGFDGGIFNIVLFFAFFLLGASSLWLMQEQHELGLKLCMLFYLLQVVILQFSFGSLIGYFGYMMLVTWNMFIFNFHLNIFALGMAVLTGKAIRESQQPLLSAA